MEASGSRDGSQTSFAQASRSTNAARASPHGAHGEGTEITESHGTTGNPWEFCCSAQRSNAAEDGGGGPRPAGRDGRFGLALGSESGRGQLEVGSPETGSPE